MVDIRARIAIAVVSVASVVPAGWYATRPADPLSAEPAAAAGTAAGQPAEPGPVAAHPTPTRSARPRGTAPTRTPIATPSSASAQPAHPAAPPPAPAPPASTPAPAAPRPVARGVRPTGCVPAGGEFVPSRFRIPRLGVDAPMITVGREPDGSPGSAPLSQLHTAAWFQHSPNPGSARGNVIVNVHAYAQGSALGNDLVRGLRAGDVVRVEGGRGRVACYRFREARRIRVADYDPNSGVYHNLGGRPQLAIMTCWDRDPRTGEYASRIILYADRVG